MNKLEQGRVRSMQMWGGTTPTDAEEESADLVEEIRALDPSLADRTSNTIVSVAVDSFDLGVSSTLAALGVNAGSLNSLLAGAGL